MDHLGIDRFLVFGCCIGGPFILKLLELAPDRVVAAVLEQPVGIIASNRELFDNIWTQWRDQLMSKRDDLGGDEIEALESMSTIRPRSAARSPHSRRPPR